MANLPEPGVTPGSLAPVRRIETTDPVLGGDPELAGNVNSPINYALQSLVNRDAYLEAKIAQAVTRVTDQTEGTPEITDPLMFGDPSDGNKNKKSEIGEVLALDLYFSKQATYEASGEYNDASEMSFRNAANAVLSNNASWSAATSLRIHQKGAPFNLADANAWASADLDAVDMKSVFRQLLLGYIGTVTVSYSAGNGSNASHSATFTVTAAAVANMDEYTLTLGEVIAETGSYQHAKLWNTTVKIDRNAVYPDQLKHLRSAFGAQEFGAKEILVRDGDSVGHQLPAEIVYHALASGTERSFSGLTLGAMTAANRINPVLGNVDNRQISIRLTAGDDENDIISGLYKGRLFRLDFADNTSLFARLTTGLTTVHFVGYKYFIAYYEALPGSVAWSNANTPIGLQQRLTAAQSATLVLESDLVRQKDAATQAEVDAGTVDDKFVVPKFLKAASFLEHIVPQATATITKSAGNGTIEVLENIVIGKILFARIKFTANGNYQTRLKIAGAKWRLFQYSAYNISADSIHYSTSSSEILSNIVNSSDNVVFRPKDLYATGDILNIIAIIES